VKNYSTLNYLYLVIKHVRLDDFWLCFTLLITGLFILLMIKWVLLFTLLVVLSFLVVGWVSSWGGGSAVLAHRLRGDFFLVWL